MEFIKEDAYEELEEILNNICMYVCSDWLYICKTL